MSQIFLSCTPTTHLYINLFFFFFLLKNTGHQGFYNENILCLSQKFWRLKVKDWAGPLVQSLRKHPTQQLCHSRRKKQKQTMQQEPHVSLHSIPGSLGSHFLTPALSPPKDVSNLATFQWSCLLKAPPPYHWCAEHQTFRPHQLQPHPTVTALP